VNRPADTQLADTKEVADSRRAAETLRELDTVSLPNCPDIGPVDIAQEDIAQEDIGQEDIGQEDIGLADIGLADIAQVGIAPAGTLAVLCSMLVVSALAMDRSVHCQSRIHPNADLGLGLGRTRHLIKR
jgi:hypothetical protein